MRKKQKLRRPGSAKRDILYVAPDAFKPSAEWPIRDVLTLKTVGRAQMLVFDSAFRARAGLRAGDRVDVTILPGGIMVLIPLRPGPGSAKRIRRSARK
jgi:hypothetical protein